jgi:hypothetical protein
MSRSAPLFAGSGAVDAEPTAVAMELSKRVRQNE